MIIQLHKLVVLIDNLINSSLILSFLDLMNNMISIDVLFMTAILGILTKIFLHMLIHRLCYPMCYAEYWEISNLYYGHPPGAVKVHMQDSFMKPELLRSISIYSFSMHILLPYHRIRCSSVNCVCREFALVPRDLFL